VIYVAYPADLRGSPKIEALTHWLHQSFGDTPHWDS